MLAKLIIPCLDVDKGRVGKGIQFVDLVDAGGPVECGQRYDQEGADELVFLDITASSDDRHIMMEVVQRVAETIFIPFTVGGGIRTPEDVQKILRAGADKVSLNTAAVKNPKTISIGAQKFGSQCMVVAIDAKRTFRSKTVEWEVFIHGGRTPTGINALSWAQQVEKLGAGEILLTSMDRDGTKDGYDLDLLKAVTSTVQIPVIASGGVGTPQHIFEGLTVGGAHAALAASIFHFENYSLKQVKDYLRERDVVVR